MKHFVIVAAIILAAMAMDCSAETISPNSDILTMNSDGEYVTIFGPDNFAFTEGFTANGFASPIVVKNGTMIIGGK